MSTVEPDVEATVQQQMAVVLRALDPAAMAIDMAAALLAAIPEIAQAADEDLRASLQLSCESNLRALWDALLRGAAIESVNPPAEAISWLRELVHRGVQLPVLLRSYRLGHQFAERRFAEMALELDIDPEVRSRALSQASQAFFAYIDAVCTQLVEDYEQERSRWIRGAAAARAELVGAILSRQPVDARTATHKLRYDVARKHVAMIVWADGREQDRPAGSLEREAVQLASALRGGPLLTVPIGERLLWAWTSGDELVDDASMLTHRVGEGARAAIGLCQEGLEGIAGSHEQAQAARRLAELRRVRSGTVVGYRNIGLSALLAADPAEAVRFAEAELGMLMADDDTAARLRATARVYLEENLSPARTARRLGIHQNTVVYRIKQVEELLGRRVDHRRLNLEVALRLSEMIDGLREAAARARATDVVR